jgi:hypothetical protein
MQLIFTAGRVVQRSGKAKEKYNFLCFPDYRKPRYMVE